jgi:hypothetical protein
MTASVQMTYESLVYFSAIQTCFSLKQCAEIALSTKKLAQFTITSREEEDSMATTMQTLRPHKVHLGPSFDPG